ncbi:hypothetical protein E2C01_041565 [Portunus trituberculatus]|uniref:Uncharacterized protein n=1 Tax=Portunus trituberculatus TaxID=210409 RepID=A0A5B7FS78_PORTR|nr:hypothetical protein [Portunus trituberculatus]
MSLFATRLCCPATQSSARYSHRQAHPRVAQCLEAASRSLTSSNEPCEPLREDCLDERVIRLRPRTSPVFTTAGV